MVIGITTGLLEGELFGYSYYATGVILMNTNIVDCHDRLSDQIGSGTTSSDPRDVPTEYDASAWTGPPLYDVSGSIVAYNNDPDQIVRAIQCFLATPLRVSLIVIDNSPQASLRSVVEQTGCSYLYLGKNVGFGAGHNIALRKYLGTSQYHLILNPDVYWRAGVLEGLFSFMEQSPRAGLTMPRVLYPDGSFQTLCKLLPTPVDLVTRRFVGKGIFRLLIDVLMGRYELRGLDFERVQSVPSLSGCFMFLRGAALKDIGLFDPRYFMYLEDVDLCRRMARKWDTLYYPHVNVYHEYAKGSYDNKVLRNHHIKSAVQYFNKWGWVFDSERHRINSQRLAECLCEFEESRAPGSDYRRDLR